MIKKPLFKRLVLIISLLVSLILLISIAFFILRPIVINHFAKSTNDISKCEIWDKEKNRCYFEYAINKENESICELLPPIPIEKLISQSKQTYSKDNCYNQLSYIKEDLTLCLKSRMFKEICRVNFAFHFSDISICDNDLYCMYRVARKSKNMAMCDLINNTNYLHDQCYYDFARDEANLSICDNYIEGKYKNPYATRNISTNDMCYHLVITGVLNDKDRCNIINDSEMVDRCLRGIDINRKNKEFWEEMKKNKHYENSETPFTNPSQ